MQAIQRTETGYACDGIQIDSKPHSSLAPQQARTLALCATGKERKEAAEHLGVSIETVKQALRGAFDKLDAHNLVEAIHKASKQGILRYTLCFALAFATSLNDTAERAFRVNLRHSTRLVRREAL